MSRLSSEKIAGLSFEQVVRSAPAAIVVVDASGRVTHSNGRARELTAALGRAMPADLDHAIDIYHPDGRRYERAEWPPFRSITAGETIVDEEFFYAVPDGARLWIRCSSFPVRDKDGEIVAAVFVQTDVSERKRGEAARRYAQRRNETILESITDAFIAVDREWRYTYLNERALAEARTARGAGLAREDVLGQNCWEFIPEAVGTAFERELRRAVREQTTVAFVEYAPAIDKWMEVRAFPSEDGLSVYAREITEPKRAEQELAYHALLVENMEDAVIATDERFLVTAWNRGAERLYRWKAREILGRHVGDAIRTDLSEVELAERFRRIATERRARSELVVHRKDGSLVDVEVIGVAVPGERGEIAGYVAIHRDVSERKRAERALRAANRRTENILESITDTFGAVDADWRYTYFNQRALDLYRKAHGEYVALDDVLGRSIWELNPQLVGTTVDHELRRAVREQKPVVFETYSNATARWVEVHAYPAKGGGLLTFGRDITERKQAEEQLERRARQQALVAELGQRALASDDLQTLMDDAVALVARTLDVELAGLAELPADSEEVILRAGVGWREGVVGSRIERGERDSQVGYTLLRGEPVIAEDQANDPRFTRSALADEHGVVSALSVMIANPDEPFGVLGVLSTRRRSFSRSDVDFVQAVANVLASAVDRSRAVERFNEIREAERSRIARDLHDEALQELTDALVQAYRGQSAGLGPAAAGQLISTLKRVSEQLRGAIYDLRLNDDVSRPFPEALRALVAVQRALAVECDIDLDVSWSPSTRLVGDRGIEVLRIVGEALTNARRHSGAGHVRVSARGSEERFCVEVTDDGHGFDPDATSSGTDRMGIKGMRERAALVGGDLDIRSTPGAGTTIRFEFGPSRHDERPATRARILLVEDHAAVRQAIAGMFQQEADLDVVGQAGSLAEARGMLEDVDVAVLDLGLPDGFGAELIRELRRVNPRAQALVLSATLDRAEVARAIEGGAAGVLNKTAHLGEVVDAVRRLQAGETLMPLDGIIELLGFAGRKREREHADREAIAQLTPREREVLQALADGLNTQHIADRLHISIPTERNHIASILTKLGVHSRPQALVLALRYQIVEIR